MECPSCGHRNAAAQKFCGECGARLTAAPCASCGASNPPGQKFCGECGAALTPAAALAPQLRAPETYTPKHLAERILTSKASLEGERKQVTVLFADLKGSMEILAERDAEEARRILDAVLERLIGAVHRYEGTVNQVMGDGIMALFGAPLAHEDHAVRACYAALRMQEAIRRYSEEARRAHGVEVQIRVGLNSGDVVVRTIGSDLRMDYTAVGQTTHLAARMEQLAPPGTIRLTADTLRLAEGFVRVTPLGPIPVKGLAEPVEVFELNDAAAVRTRLQAAHARGLTRFVGRDAEMEQIRQAGAQAARGQGQLVAVVGDPGVGKSRLFYEFIHSHHAHGWLVLEASSVSYGKATPFLPLADLLRAYFRIEDRDDARAIRAKVTGIVLTLDRALEDALPPVLWLLDAPPPDDPVLLLDPARRQQRAIEAVKRLLLRESRVQPLLLVFEDLHWIDGETQRFLDSLVDSVPAAPILLAANYRPEYRHGWGSKTYYRQLRIDPLPAATAEEVLASLLGDDATLAPLKRVLIARTEGNPLFLEESVRALVEMGALVRRDGVYRLAKPVETVTIPPTVQAIIAARIDRLSPDLKRLLQAAAVIGKDVPIGILEAITDLPPAEVHAALTALQAAEFLYELRLFPDLEYTFKHALTHEIAYGGVLQERRRALHAAIVGAVERQYAGRLAEQVEVLAHHAVRGGVQDKAVRYLRQAGEKSLGRSAIREAIGFFENALAILAERAETPETLSEMLDIDITLGPALMALKGATDPEVAAVYERALALVDRLDDAPRRFPVVWGQWFISYQAGRYAAARASGQRLLEDAQAGDDSGRLVEAHHALWPTLLAMGDARAAVPHMERGIALYDRERHAAQATLYAGHDPGACCRYQLGFARWLLGAPDGALSVIADAQRLASDLNHPPTTAVTLAFAAFVLALRGERAAAAASANGLLALAEQHGFAPWTDIALVLRDFGSENRPDAAALLARSEQLQGFRTAVWRRVVCICFLAEMSIEGGCPDVGHHALASIDDAQRGALFAPELLRLDGEVSLRTGRATPEEAERAFRAAIDLARRRGEQSLELRAVTSLARLLADGKRRDEARRELSAVYQGFREGFDTHDLRAARSLLEAL
jgi:class 3 adenylate cyclase/tetratricopeptide (TPR) repeat protein